MRIAESREQDSGTRPHQSVQSCFVAARDFLLLREQTEWQGRGAKRPGGEHVATCPVLSGATKATEKQASRQDHPSLH